MIPNAAIFRYTGSALAMLAVLMAGCAETEDVDPALDAAQALSQQAIEMYQTRNWDMMDGLVAPGYVRHDLSAPADIAGPDGLRAHMSYLETSYPDMQITFDETIVAANRTATRWTFTGTNTGPRGELAPTGRRVEITGLSIAHIENGMFVEEWVYGDQLSAVQQLGFTISPPAEPDEG